ncbi:tryptophan synthase beta subunit-like PLP-dependent enzyme [Rhodotorula diobovata]|uniref:threonine synthase n=1 Tax=Rhodotorula diobovata TaxID=5288 RepID=A0A5C5FMR3_9BASI|nr:tryptophan synthase beta subunit-like PLP-dependent enzyme [Rhodotorula diobovata]
MPTSFQYLSTRGGEERLSFEEAVLRGLAPNGGLYIPAHLPSLPENWQHDWAKLSFTELALELYSLFIAEDEIPRDDLRDLIERSYSTFRHKDVTPLHRVGDKEFILELFHGPTFAFKDVALQFLGNLFEYFLARRNADKPEGQRERLTVVGATSGDTGSAAIYGLRSKKDISIFILHPKGRTSPIQEAQMTTVLDDNVHNLAVTGTFDDCQDIVKHLFNDTEFNSRYHLGAVNSINWARILAQTVYYFAAYFAVQLQIPYDVLDPQIQFAVPTGNFGDILAGWYAKHLGLPMAQLVVATNANDILARFWKTGRYEKADSGEPEHFSDDERDDDDETGEPHQRYPSLTEDEAFRRQQEAVAQNVAQTGASDGKQANGTSNGGGAPRASSLARGAKRAPATAGTVAETLSPAMDILVSSNFERLLFYLALEGTTAGAVAADGEVDGGQAARVRMAAENVKLWMDKLKTEHRVKVPRRAVEAARRDMIADRASDQETAETIKKYFTKQDEYGSYVADPHTAVGLTVANRIAKTNPPNVIQIVLATAHPAKFDSAVSDALSAEPSFDFKRDVLPKEFEGLLEREKRVIDCDNDPEAVKKIVREHVDKLFAKPSVAASGL